MGDAQEAMGQISDCGPRLRSQSEKRDREGVTLEIVLLEEEVKRDVN
jgi:hypothetical protein